MFSKNDTGHFSQETDQPESNQTIQPKKWHTLCNTPRSLDAPRHRIRKTQTVMLTSNLHLNICTFLPAPGKGLHTLILLKKASWRTTFSWPKRKPLTTLLPSCSRQRHISARYDMDNVITSHPSPPNENTSLASSSLLSSATASTHTFL